MQLTPSYKHPQMPKNLKDEVLVNSTYQRNKSRELKTIDILHKYTSHRKGVRVLFPINYIVIFCFRTSKIKHVYIKEEILSYTTPNRGIM